jgi:FKBP-type peptidyl-prolyl cis-trans isomerase
MRVAPNSRYLVTLLLLLGALAVWRLEGDRESGVRIKDLKVGTGATLETGKTVTVHYVARVQDGAVYSETRSTGQPFTFVVGRGQVLEGWEQGIRGMREGGIRRLLIPSAFAYGKAGAPPLIPPDAALEAEIELLRVAN